MTQMDAEPNAEHDSIDMTDDNNTAIGTDERNEQDILDVSGLTKRYPDGTLAVDDIDFSVQRGDFCVIIGPSGCGKSTTLHSLIGTVEPTEGSITLDERELVETPTYDRDIGLVFQDFQLFPHLTVEENIAYGLRRTDADESEVREQVERLLDVMDLVELRDRDPEDLSAGQKQRVALSRSLALEPKLLLLDEPLGDMDYKLQKRMERELLRIHQELETTFVYVTHDQVQAMRLADQLVVMNDGKIEQSGSVDEVYNSPSTAFTATFVGDSNTFHGELVEITDDGERATLETDFGRFIASTENLDSEPTELLGEALTFAVRPQYLSVGREGENTLDCTVIDAIDQANSGTQLVLSATAVDGSTKEIQLKSRETLDIDTNQIVVSWSASEIIPLERTSVVDGVDLEEDVLGE